MKLIDKVKPDKVAIKLTHALQHGREDDSFSMYLSDYTMDPDATYTRIGTFKHSNGVVYDVIVGSDGPRDSQPVTDTLFLGFWNDGVVDPNKIRKQNKLT